MEYQATVCIDGTKEDVWRVITNIEGSVETIRAIEQIDVLENPASGLVGLKWRETRTMFGKQATEVMWITDSEPNHYYKTRAESHGMIYISTMEIESSDQEQHLKMRFEGQAQSLMGKIMSSVFGIMMNNSTKKAMFQDLQDIKKVVEQSK